MEKRKVVLYISMSIDGYLATKEDDLSWLSIVEKEGLDYGYTAMQERSDTYIVGRRTYDVVRGLLQGQFPQASKYDCYVITREDRTNENGVRFYNGKLSDLIQELRTKPGKDIYCDGGSEIVRELMKDNLIDEYIISIIPVVLGDGIRLFRGGIDRIYLKLLDCTSYETGLVQMHYVAT